MRLRKNAKMFDISKKFTVAALSKIFPLQTIQLTLANTQKESKRLRELPSHIMIYYVIASAFFMTSNLKEVLRCLLEGFKFLPFLPPIKITGKSGISQARKRLGYEPLQHLYRNTVAPIACSSTKGAWYKEWRLVSLDGSTLNVPDEKANKDYFGHPISYIEDRYNYPQLRFACLAEAGTHVLFGAKWGTYKESEVSLARQVIQSLEPGMLCLTDRGLCNYPLWCQAFDRGADLLWRCRNEFVLPVAEVLPDGSYLSTFCPRSRTSVKNQPMKVRVIEYRINGIEDKDRVYRLITSILDYTTAPALELAALYHERWEIENCFDELKTHLLSGRDFLRSKTPDLVKQEFYGLLLAHYALRGLIHEAALSADEDPDRLSFTHTLSIIKRKIIKFPSFFPSVPQTISSRCVS